MASLEASFLLPLVKVCHRTPFLEMSMVNEVTLELSYWRVIVQLIVTVSFTSGLVSFAENVTVSLSNMT